MLHVYHSNRLEALFELLCALRESQSHPDPLTPETVLVANPGIGRWLDLTHKGSGLAYATFAVF